MVNDRSMIMFLNITTDITRTTDEHGSNRNWGKRLSMMLMQRGQKIETEREEIING